MTKPLDSVREIIYHANENYEWIFPTNVSLFATQPFFDDCVAFFGLFTDFGWKIK